MIKYKENSQKYILEIAKIINLKKLEIMSIQNNRIAEVAAMFIIFNGKLETLEKRRFQMKNLYSKTISLIEEFEKQEYLKEQKRYLIQLKLLRQQDKQIKTLK